MDTKVTTSELPQIPSELEPQNELERLPTIPEDTKAKIMELVSLSKAVPEGARDQANATIKKILEETSKQYSMEQDYALMEALRDTAFGVVDYTPGLVRTAVYKAALPDQVGMQDMKSAFQGRAPGLREYVQRKQGDKPLTTEQEIASFTADTLATPALPYRAALQIPALGKYLKEVPKTAAAALRGEEARKYSKSLGDTIQKGSNLGEIKVVLKEALEGMKRQGKSILKGEGFELPVSGVGKEIFKTPGIRALDAAIDPGETPISDILIQYGSKGDPVRNQADLEKIADAIHAQQQVRLSAASDPDKGGSALIAADDLFGPYRDSYHHRDMLSQVTQIDLNPGAMLTLQEANTIKYAADKIKSGITKDTPSAMNVIGRAADETEVDKIVRAREYGKIGDTARKKIEQEADAQLKGLGGDIYKSNKQLSALLNKKLKKKTEQNTANYLSQGMQSSVGSAALGSLAGVGANEVFGSGDGTVPPWALGAVSGAVLGAPGVRTRVGKFMTRGAPVLGQAMRAATIPSKTKSPWTLMLEEYDLSKEEDKK